MYLPVYVSWGECRSAHLLKREVRCFPLNLRVRMCNAPRSTPSNPASPLPRGGVSSSSAIFRSSCERKSRYDVTAARRTGVAGRADHAQRGDARSERHDRSTRLAALGNRSPGLRRADAPAPTGTGHPTAQMRVKRRAGSRQRESRGQIVADASIKRGDLAFFLCSFFPARLARSGFRLSRSRCRRWERPACGSLVGSRFRRRTGGLLIGLD
jgi:hypothetical protein